MKLKELYERPIARYINPVATVGNFEQIEQEINEYVFTQKIIEHLYTFLNNLFNKEDGKTGVWINGYYGSGKSHFLKYIYYSLHKEYSDKALNRFEESVRKFDDPLELEKLGITPASINKLFRNIDETGVDHIMFNIDMVSQEGEAEERITRLIYNQFNRFCGYNGTSLSVANFEKQLDKEGKLEEFIDAINNKLSIDWRKDQDAIDVVGYKLEQVLDTALDIVPELDREATRSSLLQDVNISITQFVNALKRHLEEKPEDYRLVFLIDEVSQYIGGDGKLLLNLQSITEHISDECQNKVWLVCTAQQELGQVAEGTDEPIDDFGKIMGRFETRLSLESQSADFITKKRVLEKNTDGYKELQDYFNDNKTAIVNQFESVHQLYKGYSGVEEFIQVYPFVPYQFKLISEVIRSFNKQELAQEGYRNSERAIIGIIHYTAKKCKEEDVGYVVPFDAFYNNSFQEMLTHHAKNIIENALSLEDIKNNDFAKRVTRALFLISYLTEDQSIHFKSNVDNLSLVMMDKVDQSKLDLQTRIEDVLKTLEENSIVSEDEGSYRFLGDEEILVNKSINHTTITQHDRYDWFDREILHKTLGLQSRFEFEGSKINLFLKLGDHNITSSGDIKVTFHFFKELDPDHFALEQSAKDLSFYIRDVLTDRDRENFEFCVKVKAYIKQNRDTATGKRKDAMETFNSQAVKMLEEIRYRFKDRFNDGLVIIGQQVGELSEFGSNPDTIYKKVLEKHVKNVYRKREWASGYAKTNSEVVKKANDSQTRLGESLTPAEDELNNFMKDGISVQDVVEHFRNDPYGWSDTEIVDIILELDAKGKVRFKDHNESVSRTEFVNKALRKTDRPALTLHRAEEYKPKFLQEVVEAINNKIFNEQLVQNTNDHRTLRQDIQGVLDKKITLLDDYSSEWAGYPFQKYFRNFSEKLKELRATREEKKFFDTIIENAKEWGSINDKFLNLEEFIQSNGDRYVKLREFVRENENNFDQLDPAGRSDAQKLEDFIQSDRPDKEFPAAKKAWDSVSKALNSAIQEQRKEVKEIYEEKIDILEEKKVSEKATDYTVPDRENILARLDQLNSISDLKNKMYEADDFLSTELDKMFETQEKESVEVKLSRGRTVSTEEELDEFISDVKEEVLSALKEGRTVIIR